MDLVRFVEVDVVVGRLLCDHHKFIFLQLRKRVVDVFGELGLIAIHDNSPDVCEKVVPDEFCDDAPDVLRNNELCVKGGRVAFVIHHRPDDIGVNRCADVEFPGLEVARPNVHTMRCLGLSGDYRFHLVILPDDVHLPKLVCEVLENGVDLARRINIPEPVVILCYLLDPIVIHILRRIRKEDKQVLFMFMRQLHLLLGQDAGLLNVGDLGKLLPPTVYVENGLHNPDRKIDELTV